MKKMFKELRFYFISIYAILNILVIAQMIIAKMIPMKYIAVVSIVLVIIFLCMYFIQYGKRTNKVNKILGKILIILLSALLGVGNLYLFKTYSTFNKIAGDNTEKIQVSIVVMKSSGFEKIKDLDGKAFGMVSIGDTKYADQTLTKLESELGTNTTTQAYNGFDVFAEGLYSGEVDAMILNEGYRGMFEDNHPSFGEDTKIIKTYTYEEKSKDTSKAVDVTKEPFLVYISGIDTFGSISTVSRTDVNKIMAINPQSKQILLIDIPRDYYVPQTCQGNQKDKLTHTGIFGVSCTIDSVSNFFGEDINYYARVNFSSLVDIVDALGGISVTSEYAFSADEFNYIAGTNNLSGKAALAFSRE
ncbi:MAG: LCP family protein, partial [Longicatena sp.]